VKIDVPLGSTNLALPIKILDFTSTTGAGLAGLAFNSAGLTAEYRREGEATATAITLVTATLGTYTASGFKADGTRGYYELGVPNAVCASAGAPRWARVGLYGAASMVDVDIEIVFGKPTNFPLTSIDNSGRVKALDSGGNAFTYTAPDNSAVLAILNAWNLLEITGGTVNDGAPLASGFIGSAGLSATNSFYVGRLLCFTTGPLAGLKQPVTGYVGATRTFAFSTPFPAAPANGNAFVII
jgi:hypothetical protein